MDLMGNKVLLGTRQEWRNWKFRKIIKFLKKCDRNVPDLNKSKSRAFATEAKNLNCSLQLSCVSVHATI